MREVVAADGGKTQYAYNTQMETIAVTNADGHTWQFMRDLDGQIIKEVDYSGHVTETNRSPNRLNTQVNDGLGPYTVVSDLYGRITEIQEVGDTIQYLRDEKGEIIRVVNAWSTIDYYHDQYGRVVSETLTLYSGDTHTVEYEYGTLGSLRSVTQVLPDGRRVTEQPQSNEHGELSHVNHMVDGVSLAVAGFGTDEAGRRQWSSVGSLVRNFTFDDCNRIVSDITTMMGNTISDVSAGADAHHDVANSHSAGGVQVVGRAFTWRPDDALTQVVDTLRGTTNYLVDDAGRVVGVSRDRHATTLAPASTSDLSTVGAASGGGTSAAVESYGFSKAGVLTKLHADTSRRWADDAEAYGSRPHRIGRTTFTYDKAGRVIQTVTKRLSKKPLVKTFYYGSRTQPLGFSDSDHPEIGWRYIYDGMKRRVAKESIDTATGEVLTRVVFFH